jgi:hypothetical protein
MVIGAGRCGDACAASGATDHLTSSAREQRGPRQAAALGDFGDRQFRRRHVPSFSAASVLEVNLVQGSVVTERPIGPQSTTRIMLPSCHSTDWLGAFVAVMTSTVS